MAADDQVRLCYLGLLPAARDDGHVVERRYMRPHPFGRFDRGYPLQTRCEGCRVAAGTGPHVDQRLLRRQEGLEHLEQIAGPATGRTGAALRSAGPVLALRKLSGVCQGALFTGYWPT